MENNQEKILSEFLESRNKDFKNVNFSFGGFIKGVSAVANIIKAAGPVIKGLSGIAKNLFGNKVRMQRAFIDPTPYLKSIKKDLSEIKSQNTQIYNKLSKIEDNILTAIEDATNLDSRHITIEDALAGDGEINENNFSGALWKLSSLEYRPSKVPDIIYGYEGYIARVASKASESLRLNNGREAIDRVLLRSRILENNFVKYTDLTLIMQ